MADQPSAASPELEVPPKPYDRLPEESNKWFDRFTFYRLMGANRSYLGAYHEELARKGAVRRAGLPQSWRNAIKRFDWKARAEAWDEAQRIQQEAVWAKRRTELRHQEWEIAQALIEKAKQMLVFPLARTEREQRGETTVITNIYPMRWGMGDVGKLADTASKIGRLAAEMETDRAKVESWQDEIVRMLKEHKITPDEVIEELGEDAKEILIAAGVGRNEMPAPQAQGGDPGETKPETPVA